MFTDTITLQNWFNESLDLLKPSRKLALKTAEYANGEQLDNDIKLTLSSRGQPEQWENNISKIDNKIAGFKNNRTTEIKLFGRQRDDKTTALLLQDTIRAIHETSDFSAEKEASDEDIRYAGFAAQEIKITNSDEVDEFGRTLKDISVQNLPASQCFLDPHAKKQDYSDARYFHQAFWTDKDELYMEFDANKVDELPIQSNSLDAELDEEIYDHSKRDRVLVIYTWYKKYDKKSNTMKWYYIYWGGSTILKQEENPFKEYFDGMPIVVEFLRSRKNTTSYAGMYKDILPLQDALNFAKLKIWHKLGNVKVLVQKDAVDDIMVFKDEYSLDDSVTEVNEIGGVKEINQHNDISQLLSTIVDSRNQIQEILGLSDEFLATASNRMGADAMNQRINMGALGLSNFLKASSRLQENTLKKMIPLIQEFYNASRVMKIVDEDMGAKYFNINQTAMDENGFMKYEMDKDGNATPLMDNRLNIGKYDLIYTEMEKPIANSAERYRQDVELMKLLGSVAPQYVTLLLPELLADTHTNIADKIKMIVETQQQTETNDPMGDMNSQFDIAQKQLALEELKSKIGLNNSKAVYNNSKNDVDTHRIDQSERSSMRNTQTKNDQLLLNAMVQGGKR